MVLTDYTTYDEVRAVLGVTDEELEDATLDLDVYSHNLLAELEDVSLDLPAAYTTASALDEASRSPAQQRFFSATRLFSVYAVAVQLAGSLPLFSPKTITDGKAGYARYADSPYKQTIEECKAQYLRARTRLISAFQTLEDGAATNVGLRPFLSVSSPSSDPVTGS